MSSSSARHLQLLNKCGWREESCGHNLQTPCSSRPLLRFWLQRRPHLNLAQSLCDCPLQLWINIVDIILRCNIDFDIRIGAVVFDVPSHVFKPEGEFRLCGSGSIDQSMSWIDTDHAPPGAF